MSDYRFADIIERYLHVQVYRSNLQVDRTCTPNLYEFCQLYSCVQCGYLLGWLVVLSMFWTFQMGSLLEADSLRACIISAFLFSISGSLSNSSGDNLCIYKGHH